jgi:membrane protease YdiL (CAAX protease family)
VATILYSGLLLPLALPGLEADVDLTSVHPGRLFVLHALLAAALAGWGLLAFAGAGAPAAAAILAAFRLRGPEPGRELALGLLIGAGAWAAVLAAALAVAALVAALGGDGLLPAGPPPLVLYLAGQPVWLRLAISLSAGAVEETFFRGFLQPRIGLGLSSLLFVLAHAGYGQPLQLVAVALLSLIYGLLARRRGSVWAAASAHALFDAVQLLVVIPAAVELLPESG